VANLIDTTFTAKDIHTALSVYEYTATGDMKLAVQVRLVAIAGGGDYVINLRLNDGDIQTDDPMVPKTTYTAAAGSQNIWFEGSVHVLTGDVLNIMVLGLAGDTAVVGSIRIWNDTPLQPTTAGRTLDVTSTGESGLDFANINAAANPTTLTNITIPVVTSVTNGVDLADTIKHKAGASGYDRTTDSLEAVGDKTAGIASIPTNPLLANSTLLPASVISAKSDLPVAPDNAGISNIIAVLPATVIAAKADVPTATNIDTQLSSVHGPGAWGNTGTGGTKILTYTLTDSVTGLPIEGATIELYATSTMITIIDSKVTDVFGGVTFSNLIAGTYYLKIIKAGYVATTDTEVVS
jgi:hypothetical protein